MPEIFVLASWIGGVAFALSGFLVGVRKELDFMGIFILAFLTANGGGILRDVLVGKTPAVLADPSAFILVIAVFAVGTALHFSKDVDIEKRKFFVASDSLGLVAFSLTGALAGVDAGLSVFGVMVLSFITAVGGGILRDVLVNEVPAVFRSDFYGSVAVLMGLVIYLLYHFNVASEVSVTTVFLSALALRFAAYKYGWRLPTLKGLSNER